MMSAPAARYFSWISRTTSGQVSASRSLQPAQLPFPVAEPFAAVGRFVQPVALHHRAEAAVEQQDAFVEYLFDRFSHFFDDFDFKQPAPILSRDEDAPRSCVVGDAVEYVGRGVISSSGSSPARSTTLRPSP